MAETNKPKAEPASQEEIRRVLSTVALKSKDKPADEEEIRKVMSTIGSKMTEKKLAAVRANAVLGGRPVKPLSEIPCNCGRGDSLEGHPTSCLRGMAIRRRQKRGIL